MSKRGFRGLAFILVIGGVWLLLWAGADMLEAHRSKKWKQVSGEWCYHEILPHERATLYNVAGYRYVVEGQEYTSTRERFGGVLATLRSTKGWTSDLVIEVFYDPQNPQESVLVPGVTIEHVALIVAAILFAGVGIAILRNY